MKRSRSRLGEKRWSPKQFAELIREFGSSGLTQRKFCEDRRIALSVLQLQEQQNHLVSALVEDIMKVLSDEVKTQSYDLVLDKSGGSAGLGTTVLL
jgi:hypothetical protein